MYIYIHKCKSPQTLSAFDIDSPHTEYDVNNGATKNTLLLSNYTGSLIGILKIVHYNPHITGQIIPYI